MRIPVHERDVLGPARTGSTPLVIAKRAWSGFARRDGGRIDELTGSARVRTAIETGSRGRRGGGPAGGAGRLPAGAPGAAAVPVGGAHGDVVRPGPAGVVSGGR
ncbi:hypothetical protein [Streptomyces sp. NPDC003401]